jgi:hypothetical protein
MDRSISERQNAESIGPILFILFIADINQHMPAGCNIMKYADDILAYILGKCDDGFHKRSPKESKTGARPTRCR